MNTVNVAADVLTVTYGDCCAVLPLLASLQAQSHNVDRVLIWHNGPEAFARALLPQGPLTIEVHESGENLGYGGGINQLWRISTAAVSIVVNPDVELAETCVERLLEAACEAPEPVLVGGMLEDGEGKVNAFALSLTWDGVGINIDRGKANADLNDEAAAWAESHALAPSGALFAVNRARWEHVCGGPLFAESLFLYLEDLALGLRVRGRGGGLRFCAQARGKHVFSQSTGRRSALKLFHVERNRLWLQRALGGRLRALSLMPFTGLRLAAYWKAQPGGGARAQNADLLETLLRAWRVGLFAPLPPELCTYLTGGLAIALRPYMAPLRNQLQDPTA